MPDLDDILDPIARGLTGPKPAPKPEPAPEPDPKIILGHIAQVSQNARATWFGLLGLLAFVGVTLLGHQDADFFAHGAETQLPLVGITVPVKAFFFVAPMLVAGLYAYLQLYLMTLWDGLAEAPARIGGQPLSDRVFPWLLSYAALWYRNRSRKDGSAAPRSLGLVVVAVSLALGCLFGIIVLALLWWRSMPAHDEWLTLWIGLCFWFAFLVGQTGFLTVRARMAGATRSSVAAAHWGRRVAGGIAFVGLASLSWLRTEGGFENYADWIERNGAWIGTPQAATWLNVNLPTTEGISDRTDLRWFRLYPADLREAELTRKHPGWLPFDIWLDEFEAEYRARPDKDIADGTDLRADWDFITEAARRYTAPLSPPDLQGADLRNADLNRAFLPGADLRNSDLSRATLDDADLEGTLFGCMEPPEYNNHYQGIDCTRLIAASLQQARLQGADLSGVMMQRAKVSGAEMQGVILIGAEMREAVLIQAKMDGIILVRAEMQEANFSGAEMRGAVLAKAEMQDTILTGAYMQGAFLSGAEMRGANFSGAEMQGAVLIQAKMQDADCNGTALKGALAHSANLTCNGLTQDQLEGVIGDERTVLPRGRYVWSCWETAPETLEATLTTYAEIFAEQDHEKIRAGLLCNGRTRVRTGHPSLN